VDDAVVPPHERTWRHPSELGPTALDVPAGGGRLLAFSTGAVTAVLVAVLVVSFSPKRSAAPSAISATTVPAASVQLRANTAPIGVSTNADGLVRFEASSVSRDQALTMVGAPNAISSAPLVPGRDLDRSASGSVHDDIPDDISDGIHDGIRVASALPDPDERVLLLTISHTYDVAWGDLDRLDAPDGSIVITRDGRLLATFVDGDVRSLIE
jgi:hypothetical protein